MTRRDIVPRQVTIKGKPVWLVRVPQDLAGPHEGSRRIFGRDRKAALKFAKGLTEARQSPAGDFLKLPQFEQNAVLREIYDLGVDGLVAACKSWRERKPGSDKAFMEAATECRDAKRQAGVRENSLHSLMATWRAFPWQKSIGAVTAQDVETWLATKPNPKTRKNHRTNLQTLFNWCLRRGYVTASPIASVEPVRVPFKEVGILSVPDIEKLLWAAMEHDRAILGFLALVLFGGLRVEEAMRARPENFKNGVVDIGGAQTKLNVRRAFAVQPILADWLAVDGVEIGGLNMRRRMGKVRKLAGIRWSKNCLRHSCASYWLAILGTKDASRMLGHSETTLFAHYAAKVAKDETGNFLCLRPYFGPGKV